MVNWVVLGMVFHFYSCEILPKPLTLSCTQKAKSIGLLRRFALKAVKIQGLLPLRYRYIIIISNSVYLG